MIQLINQLTPDQILWIAIVGIIMAIVIGLWLGFKLSDWLLSAENKRKRKYESQDGPTYIATPPHVGWREFRTRNPRYIRK